MRGCSWLVVVAAATALAACGDDGGSGPDASGPVSVIDVTHPAWIHEPIVVTYNAAPAGIPTDAVSLTIGGEPVPHSYSLSGATLTIGIDESFRGYGEVRLSIIGDTVERFDDSWTVEPWAQSSLPAGSDPVLAVDGDGVYAAWQEGDRIRIARVASGTWTDLGTLGTSAAQPAIAVVPGALWVVWAETGTGTIDAATWDGTAWTPHASPGSGSRPALAAGADRIWLAYHSAPAVDPLTVELREASDAGFTDAGSFEVVGTPVGAIDLVDGALAFVEDDGVQVRVRSVRWDAGLPTELPAVSLARPPAGRGPIHASIARSGDSLYLAHDRWSGQSFSVHALARIGSGWTALGGALDVDAPGEARAPSIRVAADGAPVVAWRETVEDAQRGLLARWDGATWQIVGGHAWNDDAAAQPVTPVLALFADVVPVVAWHDGAVHVSRFNGPAVAGPGIATRASLAGCSLGASVTPPATLSATGCFTITGGRATPHPGLVPYDLRSELWSDGALKRRWIGLPDGMSLVAGSTGSWDAPDGTIIIKEFAYETSPGQPATRRVMETRFLRRSGGVWEGFSYGWAADGADATLLADAATTVDWPLDAGGSHTHSLPSRAQCARCHHASNGPLLGLRAGQVARWFDYGGVIAEQVATLDHLGISPSNSGQVADPYAAPHDPSESPYRRVRGYLAANCAHCHNPAGERSNQDFRWETPLAGTGLCNLLVPGDAAGSTIHQRVSSRPGMPPIASEEIDPLIVGVLATWIDSITTCP